MHTLAIAACISPTCDTFRRKHVQTLCDVVRRARPAAVIIEQSDGMRTHHSAVYQAMRDALSELGYVWRHASVDAYTDYGATHFRHRLLWVGVRAD